MISGFVNDHLLPIIPVSVKRLDENWENLDILLDTGADTGLMLGRATVERHGIALSPGRNVPATIDPGELPGNSITISPFWVELILEEHSQLVKADIREMHKLSGLLGTDFLQDRTITMDVVKDGAVNIDRIPAPPSPSFLARLRSGLRKPKLQYYPSQNPKLPRKLPWAEVTIKDSKRRSQTIYANVDTGDNGQLSLPPSEVERLGLRIRDKFRVNTIDGEVDASCGEVEIVWQGIPRTVECIQRQELDRPIIGMKLLSGNRITIDFDCVSQPAVEIAPIPRPALPNEGFLQSFGDRLWHKLAGRLWWRR